MPRWHRLGWACLAVLTALGGQPAAAAPAVSAPAVWRRTAGSVSYTMTHKFHRVVGTSHAVEVAVQVDGLAVKVMARAAVATFSSDNVNRDAHVQEVVEAARFPQVVVRAVGVLPAAPEPQRPMQVRLMAEVELHGQRHQVPAEVTLTLRDPQHVHVALTLADSLAAHHIEPPSLLFVAVDDRLDVSGDADLERVP